MTIKRALFSVLLLTIAPSVFAKAAAKSKDVEVVLEAQRVDDVKVRDLYQKPFLKDAYKITVTGKFAESNDYNAYSTLLNKNVFSPFGAEIDKYFAGKVKLDLVGNIVYDAGAEVQFGVRAKSVLGNPRAYSTTSTSIKVGEAFVGEHSHMLEPRAFYLREGWVNVQLDAVIESKGLLKNFKLGMFSFDLGRGIAFGDNYAVNVGSLGFFSDSSVDQYAPGMLLNGTFLTQSLEYDVYMALLTNRATNIRETGAQIYDQLLISQDYAASFARGFGRINYVFAARLKWKPIDNKVDGNKLYVEPYFFYNHDPEQKVDFTGDARGKLITCGMAAETEFSGFEFGFEGAFNRGHQQVYAWDRNNVTLVTDTTTGDLTQRYSNVYTDVDLTTQAQYTKDVDDDGNTITIRPKFGVNSDLNSALIPGLTDKWSGSKRFRDAYKNKYKGWMFVMDAAAFVYKHDFKVAVTGGITSGDLNPNTSKTGEKRDYKGFIPFQELYSGKRVKSFFVMGPTSNLARPFSLKVDADTYSSPIEGFSNLRFVGGGVTYKPEEVSRAYSVNANLLSYWQDKASYKFGSTTELASNHLGVEFNVFTNITLIDNIRLNIAGAVFKPGKHYTDLKGTQLTSLKAELVKAADAGVTENLPTLSDNTAYSLSCAVECLF